LNGENAELMDGRDLALRLVQISGRALGTGSIFDECGCIRHLEYHLSTAVTVRSAVRR
jgi:hypothetical protein